MTFNVEMTTRQRVKIGPTIMDTGTPPVPIAMEDVPEGTRVRYESSNPAVASIEEIEGDPMNVWVRSPGVGTVTITGTGEGEWANLPVDTGTVRVRNAVPGQINTTVGTPEDEPE